MRFIFDKSRLLVKSEDGTGSLPEAAQIATAGLDPPPKHFLEFPGERPCYAGGLRPVETLPASCEWMDLRGLLGTIGEELFRNAGRAKRFPACRLINKNPVAIQKKT